MTEEIRFEIHSPCPRGDHNLTILMQLVPPPSADESASLHYVAPCPVCQKDFYAKEIPSFMMLLQSLQESILDGPTQHTVYADGEEVYGTDYSVDAILRQYDKR
mgnify:CR=1 FL=1